MAIGVEGLPRGLCPPPQHWCANTATAAGFGAGNGPFAGAGGGSGVCLPDPGAALGSAAAGKSSLLQGLH